jgi:hypothetical protein
MFLIKKCRVSYMMEEAEGRVGSHGCIIERGGREIDGHHQRAAWDKIKNQDLAGRLVS